MRVKRDLKVISCNLSYLANAEKGEFMGKSIILVGMLVLWTETPTLADESLIAPDIYVGQTGKQHVKIYQAIHSIKKCWWGRWIRWKCRRTIYW
jgi:hypothetical protein